MLQARVSMPEAASENSFRQDLIAAAMLLVLVAGLFLGAPHGGDFYWSDAPRHALNGVFVADFIRTLPFDNPAEYAYAYYGKYPALTILFYPPLFYFFLAPFYWVFGVSHESALAAVFVLYSIFALGSYRLFRFWLSWPLAILAAAGLLASPEIAFWGRQLMLEIPAFALLVWSSVYFTRFRQSERWLYLYLAAALLVLAMYTKISAGFMGLVFLLTLIVQFRARLWRAKHAWIIALISLAGLVPLIILTVKFGQANLQSVAGVADAVATRDSLAGWLWYSRQMPSQTGWPLLICALGAGVMLLIRGRHGMSRNGLSTPDLCFWGGWLFIGYVFFSSIDLKEARHSVFILPPLFFAAYMLLQRLGKRLPLVLAGLLTGLIILQTVIWRPVLYVGGYAETVAKVAALAPRESAVLFSGYRDGAFIFNMRARQDRPDLSVVRSDKLLLTVAVRRELGVAEKGLSEQEILEIIDRMGIHYVVAQPGFWDDLAVMQRLERVLNSDRFERVAVVATPANFNAHEKKLVIYRNLGNVQTPSAATTIDLPIIGRKITVPK